MIEKVFLLQIRLVFSVNIHKKLQLNAWSIKILQRCLEAVSPEDSLVDIISNDQDAICGISVEIVSGIETLIPYIEPVDSSASIHSKQVNYQQSTTTIEFLRKPMLNDISF